MNDRSFGRWRIADRLADEACRVGVDVVDVAEPDAVLADGPATLHGEEAVPDQRVGNAFGGRGVVAPGLERGAAEGAVLAFVVVDVEPLFESRRELLDREAVRRLPTPGARTGRGARR